MAPRRRTSFGWFAAGFLLLIAAGLGVAMLAAPQALRELQAQEREHEGNIRPPEAATQAR